MRPRSFAVGLTFCALSLLLAPAAETAPAREKTTPRTTNHEESAIGGSHQAVRYFAATGVIESIGAGAKTIVIQHDAISNLMAAMTMEFKVKDPKSLEDLARGERISFRLTITDQESWVDQIIKLATEAGSPASAVATFPNSGQASPRTVGAAQPSTPPARHPLLDYHFTNELGQAVSLDQFNSQALAITFFFTRCPIPEYCPRLSRNFQTASQKLAALPTAPTNWHFLSVTIDPGADTPAVLKTYAEAYQYDPAHWSFLTGSSNAITELARESGATFEPDSGFFNHNFRTLIIDTAGHLQMVFPTSGDLSEAIVQQMLKAVTATKGAIPLVSHP